MKMKGESRRQDSLFDEAELYITAVLEDQSQRKNDSERIVSERINRIKKFLIVLFKSRKHI
jgi:hypothetical protein